MRTFFLNCSSLCSTGRTSDHKSLLKKNAVILILLLCSFVLCLCRRLYFFARRQLFQTYKWRNTITKYAPFLLFLTILLKYALHSCSFEPVPVYYFQMITIFWNLFFLLLLQTKMNGHWFICNQKNSFLQ